MEIRLNRGKKFQTFEYFGASGAWWAQIVGGWEHTDPKSGLPMRDRISQLLYSRENGIGLGVYRYNLGAGSLSSQRDKIDNPARRTESFDVSDGIYDFSRDQNAVYMMKRAVLDGAKEVVLFVNSPIERLTKNRKAHNDLRNFMRDNIRPKQYKAFAQYCLDVAEHFVQEGLPVKYISPVNEPVWIWMGGQEGCHYHPVSAGKVMKCFAEELKKRPKLAGVKLSGLESGDIRWFNKSYTRELMRYREVRDCIDSVDVHSYCLPLPFPLQPAFYNDRKAYLRRFRKWMDRHYPDVPVKMSEWTHMQGGRDKTMDSALVMAAVMYEDITILNVTSWQHWIAVSEVDFCDGLIYINLNDQTIEMTKRYYATGNFSKYIPYGAERIEITGGDDDLKLMAFEKDGETIVLVINETYEQKTVSLPGISGTVRQIITSKSDDLKEYTANADAVILPGRSVNTLIF